MSRKRWRGIRKSFWRKLRSFAQDTLMQKAEKKLKDIAVEEGLSPLVIDIIADKLDDSEE